MRLKLNRTLRAALIAAITAVGTTLPQAFAETNTNHIDTGDSSLISWFSFAENNEVTEGSKKTGWNNLLTYNAEGHYGTTGTDHSMNGGITAKGGSFTISFDINSMEAGTLLHMNTSGGSGPWRHVDLTSTAEKALTLKFMGNNQTATATVVDEWSTVTITGNGTVLTMYLNGQSQGTVDISGATNWNNENLTSIRFGSENGSSVQTAALKNILVYSKALSATEVMALTSEEEFGTYTWVGGDTNEWSSSAPCWTKEGSQAPVAFTNGNDALFNSTGAAHATLSVAGDIVAGTVTVDSATYTFNIGADASITAGKLAITGTGAKLTVNGDGRAMTVTELANDGELVIGEGASVNASTTSISLSGSKTFNVSGDGTLTIQKLTVSGGTHSLRAGVNMTEIGLNGGTLTFANGTSTVSGKIYSNSDTTKLVIGAETGETAVLKANRIEMGDVNNNSKHHDLTINAGGTLKITGVDDGTNYKSASLVLGEWGVATPIVTVKGKLIAEKTHILAGDKGYTMDINGGTVLAKGLKTNGSDRTQTINISNSGKLILGDAGIINSNTHNGVTLTVDNGTIGIYADSVTIDKAIALTGDVTFDTQKYTVDDITVAHSETGGTLTVSGNITGTGAITKTGAGTLVLAGTGNALGHTMNVQGGTLQLSGTVAIDNITDGEQIVKTVDYEGRDSVNGFHLTTGTVKVYATSGDGQVSVAEGGKFTYQNGDVTNQVVNGVYTLAGTPDKSVVYVNENSLNIAGYKAAAGDALTSVVLANGTTLIADSAATYAITLADNASATVNATAATTLSSVTGLGDGQLTVTGTGLVTLGSAITGNKVVVDNGKIDLGALTHTLNALEITNGSTAVVSGLDSDKGCVSGTISIGAGSVLTVNGHHDAFGYHKDTATQKIVLGGTNSDHKAVLELNPTIQNAGTVTMTTDIEMNGYAAITTTVKGFNTYDCSITATGVENSIDQMYLRNAVTITVNGADGELTIGKLQRTPNFDGALTKAGEGKLVFNGTDNVLDKAIIVNAGTLALDGTFSIGAISGTENTGYAGGAVNGNGFKTSSTTRTVYTKGEEATVTTGQDAHFMVGEEEVTLAADGTATTAAVTDYSKFYVNSETELVSKALESHEPTAFQLAASSTLQVDRDIAATVTGTNATSVVSIVSGKVLTGTAQNVKLAGSGTYALNGGTMSLGTGVSLGEAWEGTVRLSGNIENIKFDSSVLGNHVEVCGVSGYFYDLTVGGRGTYAGTLTLTNPDEGTPALLINNGYSRDNAYYELSGTVDGNGTWRFSKNDSTVTNRIIFSGDTAGWDGAIELTKGYALELTFAQTDGEMGAAITRNGGTLNMIVGNADGQSTTFNQQVTASALTINAGAIATFAGVGTTNTFGSLDGSGTLVVNEGVTLKITGNVSDDIVIDAMNGAVIDAAQVNPEQVGIAADATATFAQGITDASGVVFTKEGGVEVKNTNGPLGGESINYSIGEASAKVTADTLTYTGAGDTIVANQVAVGEILNYGEGPLTLTHVDTDTLQSIGAYMDGVTLHNVGEEAIELKDITLLGTTVAVYTAGVDSAEGTVTITDTLYAGGSTLLANLKMADGSTLNVNGGNIMALTLGSEFTIADDALVTLDDTTLAAIAGLVNIGDKVILIKQYGDHELTTNLVDGDWSRTHFDLSSITDADYKLFVQDGQIGLVKSSMVPEPTTGTLSLLALCALAARRRKR